MLSVLSANVIWGIQLESKTERTAQLVTDTDMLTVVGHKPWPQKSKILKEEANVCLVC